MTLYEQAMSLTLACGPCLEVIEGLRGPAYPWPMCDACHAARERQRDRGTIAGLETDHEAI